MNNFELLSRCTAIPIKSSNISPYKYHILGSFHITAPYLFEKYYPSIINNN